MIFHPRRGFTLPLTMILIIAGALTWEVRLPAARAAQVVAVTQLQVSSPQPQARYEVRAVHDPDGTGRFYMGREIAQVMGAGGWHGSIARNAKQRRSPQW